MCVYGFAFMLYFVRVTAVKIKYKVILFYSVCLLCCVRNFKRELCVDLL